MRVWGCSKCAGGVRGERAEVKAVVVAMRRAGVVSEATFVLSHSHTSTTEPAPDQRLARHHPPLTLAPPTSAAAALPKRPRPSSPSSDSSLANKRTLVTPSRELEHLHLSPTVMSAQATELYSHLQREWNKGPDSLDQATVKQLLAQLKVHLSDLGLLFPDSDKLDQGALTTARPSSSLPLPLPLAPPLDPT